MKALTDRFAVRTFAFSSAAGRVDDPTALGFDGTRTDLASALDRVREDLSSVPLSGIIVVSDGADNGGRVMAESLVPLQATSIPVFTVGLGEEVLSPDVQLDRVQAPRSVLLGSAVVVDVVVSQRGFAGQPVVLEVEDDGRILTRQDVPLGRNGEPVVARVRLIADRVGPRRLIFRIPVAEGERVTGNNRRELLMDVQDTRQKILYFEGEPRFEVKFMRRAIEDDENIQLVVLQRTAPDKFLRLDVDGSRELQEGFPEDPRGAVPLSGPDPGERGGRLLHPRPTAHDPRLREPTRRGPARARGSARIGRGWLRRDTGGGRHPGGTG